MSPDDKDTRERRVNRDHLVKLALKGYQALVDQEAFQEYWAPKVTGDPVENLGMLDLGESRGHQVIQDREES